MKRGDFIKNIFTLIAVPTLTGGLVSINPFDEKKPQVFNATDFIRFYGSNIDKYRCGDIIVSDMGDTACIVKIVNFGERYAEARPVRMGEYRYKDIGQVHVMARAIGESS